jgi:hypothetical protein
MRIRPAVACLLLLLVPTACSSGSDDAGADAGPSASGAAGAADEGIDGVLAIRIPSSHHVQGPVTYDRHPPAGGDHNPVPARCGFYDEAIPDEFAVHSMEHGAVWLAYSPTLDETDLAVIHELVRDHPETIAAPYTGLDEGTTVVASAWARQLSLTSVADPRLAEFVDRYQDGDQAPEASIPCAGQGAGQPLP